MHRTRAILSIVLIAAGLVWMGQGSGLLKGSSFMVGDPKWTLIGAAFVIVGMALGWLEVRRRARQG
jgi:F0F1-type ATP synthase assembly protein I